MMEVVQLDDFRFGEFGKFVVVESGYAEAQRGG